MTEFSAAALSVFVANVSLLLRTRSSGRNQAQFQWGKGPAVPVADFGDPTGGELLQLCVYAPTGPDTWTLALAASPSPNAGGVWTARSTGWNFRSATGASDGVTGVALMASAKSLKAKVQVKVGANPAFPVGLLLSTSPGVVAQFRTSIGTCWGATFSAPTTNTARAFKATSD